MSHNRSTMIYPRRVLLSEPGGKRPRGSPRLRWEDEVKEDAAKLGCTNWTVYIVIFIDKSNWSLHLPVR